MRIAIHDYAGHPFQFELSHALARRGHVVGHFYFAEDIGPKGALDPSLEPPPGLSIEPISIGGGYSKANFLRRRDGDLRYGATARRRIADFRPEVILSGNTPLDAQAGICAGARQCGAAFVFWMQDCFSLAVEGLLGTRWMGAGRLVAEYYKHVERRLLQSSDALVLISEDFTPLLDQFGVSKAKAFVIANWGALNSISVRPKTNPWAQRHGLVDKFVFLYSGTLALKHNPGMLWALAQAFRDDPEVSIVLAAAGVSLDALRTKAAAEPAPNLVFLPLQPAADFPDVLGAADVVLALLENSAGEFSVPSKVLSYLCAGRPILLSAPPNNLAARIVERAGAGLVIKADDQGAFLQAARRLRQDASARNLFGQAGRQYAERTFDIETVADRFEAAIDFAAGRRSGRE